MLSCIILAFAHINLFILELLIRDLLNVSFSLRYLKFSFCNFIHINFINLFCLLNLS